MKLDVIAGRNFSSSDADKEQYILMNERAVKALGLKDYQQAVGRMLWINDSSKLEIAGVVKDFKYVNAGSPVMPLAFRNKKNRYNYLYLGVEHADKQALNSRIQNVMIELAPSQSFNTTWLDEQLAKNNSQAATISLLGYLAFMAVAIASLGLLGLVIYTVEVKRKEISIRKIIGAESKQLVRLLSQGFVKLLFIAGFIAMPVGYTAGFLFLQNFSDRISFGIGNALLCFLLLLIIGLVTIISQTYKAAVENPAKSLRME
jgi:putative ABC transport system permease protein